MEIHLHDGYVERIGGYVVRKDHLPLGKGNIPLKEFVKYLVKYEFKGVIVFGLPLNKRWNLLNYYQNSVNIKF